MNFNNLKEGFAWEDEPKGTPLAGFDRFEPTKTQASDPFELIDNIVSEYSDGVRQQEILEDERLMDIVYGYLNARRNTDPIRGAASTTWLTGGSTVQYETDFKNLPKEEAFEMFQNHMRSFNGGQTVTTLNELTYVNGANEETRIALGKGHYLFDQMSSPFTGAWSWDMADAVKDYVKAGVWDPTTLASFGVGKLATSGATKAGSYAVKKGITGLTGKAVTKAAANKVLVGGTATVVSDALFEAGKDVAYQSTMLKTGAQEEYSGMQTAVSAIASMLVPVGLYGLQKGTGKVADWAGKKLGSGGRSLDIQRNIHLTAKKAKQFVRERMDMNALKTTVLDDTFGKINPAAASGDKWADMIADELPVPAKTTGDLKNDLDFIRHFWLGDEEAGVKGYYQALKENGFVVMPTVLKDHGDRITGVFAETIEFLDKETIEKAMDSWEKATGRALSFTDRTPKGLQEAWTKYVEIGSKNLWLSSQLSRMEAAGKSASQFVRTAADEGAKNATGPLYWRYFLAKSKQSLTSHLATTGANLKGFAALASLDTASDIVSAMYYKIGQGGAKVMNAFSPAAGWDEVATRNGRMAFGSYIGAMKKGFTVLDPEMSYKYAEKVLDEFPDMKDDFLRILTGDSAMRDAKDFYNIQGNTAVNWLERYTSAASAVSLVNVQDEVTKKLWFAATLDKYIGRAYGVTPDKFWKDNTSLVEIHSDFFKENVLKKAFNDVSEVTASKTWSRLPQNNFFRHMAAGVEKFSRNPVTGWVLPFGSFLNTTIMHAGDYSGLNAIRSMLAGSGKKVDFGSKTTTDLLAKATVGWTLVGIMAGKESLDVEKGLSYSQDERGTSKEEYQKLSPDWITEWVPDELLYSKDGSINEAYFDWPHGMFKLAARVYVQGTAKDPRRFDPASVETGLMQDLKNAQLFGQRVLLSPDFKELRTEALVQVGAAGLKDVLDTAVDISRALVNANEQGWGENIAALLGPIAARPVQNFTRPFDGINTVVGLVKGNNMNPDRAQGNKVLHQALRYIDHIVGHADNLEIKAEAGQGVMYNTKYDTGKQALGVRSSNPPTQWERMMNAAEMNTFWNLSKELPGPAEVRNAMNEAISPILKIEAAQALEEHPEFLTYDLEAKRSIMRKVNLRARERVRQLLDDGLLGAGLKELSALSGANKGKVREIMKNLGYEGKPEDLLDDPDGAYKLKLIKTYLDDPDLFDVINKLD